MEKPEAGRDERKSSNGSGTGKPGFQLLSKSIQRLLQDYGMDSTLGLQLSAALGGGLRIGETCGALLGALMVVGLKYGVTDPLNMEGKARCDEEERKVSTGFLELNGSILCRNLLGIDTSIGDNRNKAKEMGLFNSICPGVIERTIELLEELGY
jgi:C_GCAxxG_C_C family probable redox protein